LPAATHAFDQSISSQNPKLANTFLQWTISDQEATQLAKWDVLILDMENQINNPGAIKKIRQLHPDITILAYVSSQEIRNDVYTDDQISLRRQMFAGIPEEWYLRDIQGQKISFWPETWMLNISDECPLVNGERFNDYLPQFIQNNILSTGLWDGVFYDNLWDSVSWLNNGQIDLNSDSRAEVPDILNQSWRTGVLGMLQKTRQLIGYDYILMANSSSFADYHKYLNGRLYEDFPVLGDGQGTWQAMISDYQKLKKINVSPQIYIVNSTNNFQTNYQKMRFGLATCLLFDDLYFSYDRKVSDHNQTWWYDEYNLSLGLPQGPAYLASTTSATEPLWRRDFQNGSVLLNNNLNSVTTDLGENNLKRLPGQQDPKVNNGSAIGGVVISYLDGLILEKRITLPNEYFKNGYSYEVYNSLGQKIHSPIKLTVKDYKLGQLVKIDSAGKAITTKVRAITKGLKLPQILAWAVSRGTKYDVLAIDINSDGLKEYLIAK
jgi:hypothetical protein